MFYHIKALSTLIQFCSTFKKWRSFLYLGVINFFIFFSFSTQNQVPELMIEMGLGFKSDKAFLKSISIFFFTYKNVEKVFS